MTPSPTTQEIIARREAVLAYITAHVGKILPVSRLIAVDMGCTTAQIDHAFRMLSREGAITCTGNGNSRVIMVTGVGSTLPRYLGKEVSSYVAREPERDVIVFRRNPSRAGQWQTQTMKLVTNVVGDLDGGEKARHREPP